MMVKKVLLCWSVAVSFGALLPTCTQKDNRYSTDAEQLSPRRRDVGRDYIHSPVRLVAERIRARIEAAGATADLRAGGEPVYASEALPGFYVQRFYRPVWSDRHGPTRLVDDLVNALCRADLEGLRPEDYHLASVETLLAAVRTDVRSSGMIIPDRWAELDLLLTDAFLVYGSHLLAGRVNPETLQPEWVANRRGADLAAVLVDALASGDIAGTLAALAPPQPGFRQLRDALVYHRTVAAGGGWPTIPDKAMLKKGDHGPSVEALRERLRLGGDLGTTEWEDTDRFDDALEQALKRFQRRHGLTADGAIDTETRAELNVSAEQRVEQLELNLERWRWLPQDLGRCHILVNIAAFELEVVEEEKVVFTSRVVVGLPYHSTPVFSSVMRYIVLNPYWYVPRDIAVRELLSHVQRDPSYLARQNMQVFQGWGLEAQGIDPVTIDWSKIDTVSFPFQFSQNPGPANALGRLKFMFLNKFNVYLHDTPSRTLFEETQRDFSHGCIRIQQPVELALYLLRQDPRWNRDTLLHAMDEEMDRSVPLPEPVPIHLLYWTAWADEDRMIQLRRDIYGRDAPLLKALRAPSPAKD